jgi:hypothetical protein
MVTYNAKMKRILNPPPPRPHLSTATSIPPPPKNKATYSPAQSNGPSLGRVVAEGFAFGTGSAVARQVVNNTVNAIAIPSNTTSDEDNKKVYCKRTQDILETCIVSPANSDCSGLFEDYLRNCID